MVNSLGITPAEESSASTTLILVLQLSNGALLVPLKKAASILGLEIQTVRNRMSEQKFELTPIKIGCRIFFRAEDIAHLIDARRTPDANTRPTRGRPKKSGAHPAA